jgi:two-component system chemotaxis response regulator CheB
VEPTVEHRTAARVVAIGASAGGLQALSTLLESLGPDFPVPVLVVQHLSPDHESQLARILAGRSALPVHEVLGGERPKAGHVYVAPPNEHLVIEAGRLALSHAERVSFSRPSVDVLFQSAARSFRGGVIGVLLSGSGTDGTEGARAIRAAGGRVVAQTEGSAQHYGMPGSAVAAGAVDAQLPLEHIGAYLRTETGEH